MIGNPPRVSEPELWLCGCAGGLLTRRVSGTEVPDPRSSTARPSWPGETNEIVPRCVMERRPRSSGVYGSLGRCDRFDSALGAEGACPEAGGLQGLSGSALSSSSSVVARSRLRVGAGMTVTLSGSVAGLARVLSLTFSAFEAANVSRRERRSHRPVASWLLAGCRDMLASADSSAGGCRALDLNGFTSAASARHCLWCCSAAPCVSCAVGRVLAISSTPSPLIL